MPNKHPNRRREDYPARSNRMLMSLGWTFIFLSACAAYTPDVNHRAIAGLWKLKQKPTLSSRTYPLKEFTVYPKVPTERNINENNSKEVLLMLKEDGSFQQYSDQDQKVPDKLRFFDSDKANMKDDAILDRYSEFGKLKGKWDLVGSKLILATDRPIGDDGKSSSISETNDPDTILEGEVVATTEEGLRDNPVLSSQNDDAQVDDNGNTLASGDSSKPGSMDGDRNDAKSSCRGKNTRNSVIDTHLSVPKGQVNVGRFTYPPHHPSFFEAPMFNPREGGKFELKQVLGTLNTQQEDEVFEEKFSAADFYDKTFLLTSHPIPKFRPKGNIRWSIKYNKFVEDPPKKSKKQEDEEGMMDKPVHNIRVLEVKFFANNTFATIGGMGGSAILRGKFSVIGKEKDHIWMQVIRFGFGRSVSGSVFSEGKSLTKDDEKAYWGKIEYDGVQPTDDEETPNDMESNLNPLVSEPKMDKSSAEAEPNRKLSVKGSVLFGYGLEPLPVGRFVLTETNSEAYDSDEEDEDEDDDEEEEEEGKDDISTNNFGFDPDDIFQ